tara:strand:- start:7589 stop:7816 length:228 start_codon:yes stop_codon:yes gene_type:complete
MMEGYIMDNSIEELKQTIKKLEEEVDRLREENKSLWFILEEQDNSSKAIGEAIQETIKDTLEEQLLKSFKPVGDA